MDALGFAPVQQFVISEVWVTLHLQQRHNEFADVTHEQILQPEQSHMVLSQSQIAHVSTCFDTGQASTGADNTT